MDDSEIISMFFKRDERAIEEARRRYGSIFRTAAENILGRGEDADECVSDAFLAAWESIPPQRPAALGAYLGKTARNLAINRLRAMRAQKRGGGEAEAVFDEMSTVVHGTPSPEAAAERRELLRAVNGFLASLPPERRGMFVCRCWYFDSISDIARRYGRSENYVSVSLNRTRAKLRKYLIERGFDV